MKATAISLLDRLKRAAPDAPEWSRLHDIYRPLIRAWLLRVPGLRDEIADLEQEVLTVVARQLPTFQRQREGSFRAWLKQITINKTREFSRGRDRRPVPAAETFLLDLEQPGTELSRAWDTEHDRVVFERLCATIRDDFSPTTWEAFQRFALQGNPAAQVAAAIGISENAVLRAKSRILKRLRDEAGALLD